MSENVFILFSHLSDDLVGYKTLHLKEVSLRTLKHPFIISSLEGCWWEPWAPSDPQHQRAFSPLLSWTSESSHYPSFPFPSWNFMRLYLEADVFTHHIGSRRTLIVQKEVTLQLRQASSSFHGQLLPPASLFLPAALSKWTRIFSRCSFMSQLFWFPFPVTMGFLRFGLQPRRHTVQTPSFSSSIRFHLFILLAIVFLISMTCPFFRQPIS